MEEDYRDSLDYTPSEILKQALKDVEDFKPDACIVLFLNKGPDDKGYNTRFFNSGLCASEMVSLLDVVKYDIIKGYIRG